MDIKESMLFGIMANLSVNREWDSRPDMTINLLEPVALLEEIGDSAVFHPR